MPEPEGVDFSRGLAPKAAAEPVRRSVLPETMLIALVGGGDLLFTSYLVATGQAWEGNPLMRAVLERFGGVGLVMAKATLLAGPLAVAEWARRHCEATVRRLLRLALVVYLVLWGWGLYSFNLSR